MSVSFDRWRLARRRQFEADLRFLRQAPVARRPRAFGSYAWRSWWRRHRATVEAAVLAGLALGLAAVDLPATRSVPRETIVLRGPSDVRSVLDGDTFKAGGTPIRLHGIDAPELKQTCDGWAAGEAARHALVALVTAGTPQCEPIAKDVYGRTVAVCRVNGKDVSEAMVRSGMAYAAYSHDYLLQEWRAKFDGLGIHARRCADPADWRASHRK
jgi:endonuclease YncB( thermonuclease family)